MFSNALDLVLTITTFTLLICAIKIFLYSMYKIFHFQLLLGANLVTVPLFIFVYFAYDLVIGDFAYYTIFLLIFTVSIYEFNILYKRLFDSYSVSKLIIYVLMTNIFTYALFVFLVKTYF
ncbi:MAG: hypothetical protein WC152_01415 [Candidatus Izemoplasmatales bacterium]